MPPGPAGKAVRRVHRPDPADRAGTTRAAAGSLARGLGSPARQPGLRRPLPYLTSREHNKLTPTQAQTVIAAAILRQLHAIITTGQAWDPVIAAHGTRSTPLAA